METDHLTFPFKVTDMEGIPFLIEEEIRLNYGKKE
jgi:hypothetical protein